MYYTTGAEQAHLGAWVESCKEYRRVVDSLSTRSPGAGKASGDPLDLPEQL
jgi:hypothetical protein